MFLGIGLGGVNALRAEGEHAPATGWRTRWISSPSCARLDDLSGLPVGRRVVVIGGGMTAIDAGVQSKLLGAEEVTICYRRGQGAHECQRLRAGPRRLEGRQHPALGAAQARDQPRKARVTGIELEYTRSTDGRLQGHRPKR